VSFCAIKQNKKTKNVITQLTAVDKDKT